MNKTFTHKDIRYELKETQGFYYCLVYAQGEETALFQTKYYASVEGARKSAIEFIEEYTAYRKTKEDKGRKDLPQGSEVEEKAEETSSDERKRPFRPAELWASEGIAQSKLPKESKANVEKGRPVETRKVTRNSKVWQEGGQIRSAVSEVEEETSPPANAENELRSRSSAEKERQKARIRPLPVILLASIALISVGIVIASALGLLDRVFGRNRRPADAIATSTATSEMTPTSPEATIGLPALSSTGTPDPNMSETSTLTMTPTVTSVPPSGTPTETASPTNTMAPTNTRAAPKTATPPPTSTNTPSPTATPTEEPTLAPPPTAPYLPTATPTPNQGG